MFSTLCIFRIVFVVTFFAIQRLRVYHKIQKFPEITVPNSNLLLRYRQIQESMFINPICFIIQLPILCRLHSKITNLSRKGTHKKLVTITLNKMKTHVKKRVIQIHPSFPLFYLKSFRHICSSDFIVFVGQHSFFKLTRFKHLQKKTSTFFSSLSFLKNWVLLTELLMQIYHCKGFLKLTF